MLLVILSVPEIADAVIARRPKADVAISYPSLVLRSVLRRVAKDRNSRFTSSGESSRIVVKIMMITAFLPSVGVGAK